MACRAFGYYVRSGVHNPDTPRNPSYTMYKKIFTEDESELLKLLREISKEENRE
jgi:hypothetical protein